MSAPLDLRIFPDRPALFQAAADEFVRQARAAIQSSGRFTVALAGGSTPKGLYSLLATHTAIPWDKVRFFFGDERHVPPDDPESNYRMARETLLSKVPIPSGNVYRVPAENPDAGQAAQSYEHTLRQFFQTPPSNLPTVRPDSAWNGPRRSHRVAVPGRQGTAGKVPVGGGGLGREVQDGPHHAHAARPEQCSCGDVSGERRRQSGNAERSSGRHPTGRPVSL